MRARLVIRRTYVPDVHSTISRQLRLTSGFDFWSSGHLRMAMMIDIYPPNFVRIALSNTELLTFSEIQNGGRRHLEFSSYVNLAHSDMLTVWCLSSVPNLVQISVIVTDIGHRCTYALDVHLMTSRKLTSGFEFWSRGHLHMAVSL